MVKDDAIVISEATEIMRSLPTEMQRDDQIMEAVLASLQQGQSKLEVRQDALEIAHMKLQKTVTHGFSLVNEQFVAIKHKAKIDRIHAEYAQKEAQQAAVKAEKALEKAHEVAIATARAEAKADGARDEAKRANRFVMADPLLIMLGAAILLVAAMTSFARLQVVTEPKPNQPAPLICGKDLACNIPMQSQPANQPTNNFKGRV